MQVKGNNVRLIMLPFITSILQNGKGTAAAAAAAVEPSVTIVYVIIVPNAAMYIRLWLKVKLIDTVLFCLLTTKPDAPNQRLE
jgi:hypothetical protein